MSHPYTDHYPSGLDINQRLSDHEKRIKQLESKLGAVEAGLSTDREAVGERPITASSPPAAPSVSAEDWRSLASINRSSNRSESARACDLAAAVTAIYESTQHLAYDYDSARMKGFTRVCLAFVRGEPLPEKME